VTLREVPREAPHGAPRCAVETIVAAHSPPP
jgi:hypothetical protein